MPESERRTEHRYRINQMIGYFPNREEYLWAEGIDISRGGLSCISKSPIAPLTNLYLMLAIPTPEGERLVRCEGYVKHSRMDGQTCHFGVRIERVDEDDRPYLEAFLQSLEGSGAGEHSSQV